MKKIIVATAALLLAACATPTPTTDQPEDKRYVTGSRLPVKDKSSSSSTAVTSGPPPPGTPRSPSSAPSKTLGGG